MRETVWINIPLQFNALLDRWSDFYAYDTEDSEVGKLVAYRMDTNTKEYESLISFLEETNIYHYVFRRWYRFTKKEMDNAEILWFRIDDDAQDSSNLEPITKICSECRERTPIIDRKTLYVDYKKIKKYDITSTYNGELEIIISDTLKKIFENEGITGVEFEPIYHLGKEGIKIDDYYHLKIYEGIGEVVSPSITKVSHCCPICGFHKEFLIKTLLNFRRNTWSGFDICYTKDWFGSSPNLGKIVIISQKLRKILIERKIKYIYFQPAYLVD